MLGSVHFNVNVVAHFVASQIVFHSDGAVVFETFCEYFSGVSSLTVSVGHTFKRFIKY